MEVRSLLNKNKLIILNLVVVMIFVMPFLVEAKTARNIGLGDNYSALEGVNSYSANPAGLIERDNNWSFVSDSNGGAWGNFIASSGDAVDLNEALAIIEDENLAMGLETNLGGRMYYRAFGAGLNTKLESVAYSNFENFHFILDDDNTIDLSSDTVDVIDMEINNLGAKGAAYADASLSYGFSLSEERIASLNEDREAEINDINFGFTGHYLQGAIFELRTEVEELKVESINQDLYYSMGGATEREVFIRHSEEAAATGYAFDLGMNMRVNDKYQFAFSVMNIGEMKDSNILESGVKAKLEGSTTTNNDGETVYSEINTDEDFEDRRYDGSLTYKLPRTIRLGGSMDYNEELTLYGDYANVSYDGLDDSEHKFGIGAEARWMEILALRMGLNYSTLRKDIEIPVGLGIHFSSYKVDFGFNDLGAVWNSNKGLSFGISSRLEF